MSGLPEQVQNQPPSAPQSGDDALGEVQDILAERMSTTLGCSEVLVTPSDMAVVRVERLYRVKKRSVWNYLRMTI